MWKNTHTHTHLFNGPLSGITRVSWYQKGKTNLDFTEARDSEWQWHQLGCMQVCTSLQTDNHASTQPLSFLQAGCPSCRPPTNSVKAMWKKQSLEYATGKPSTCQAIAAINLEFASCVELLETFDCLLSVHHRRHALALLQTQSHAIRTLTDHASGLGNAFSRVCPSVCLSVSSLFSSLYFIYFYLFYFSIAICSLGHGLHTFTAVPRSTQPCIPPGSLNRVPASAGVKTGMSVRDPIRHMSSCSCTAMLHCELL